LAEQGVKESGEPRFFCRALVGNHRGGERFSLTDAVLSFRDATDGEAGLAQARNPEMFSVRHLGIPRHSNWNG
jgi:hypothetical protein